MTSGGGSDSKQLHFVLVHGAGHGAWCWYKIQTLLEGAGHKVTCIDLKCSGIDRTDFNTVFTFAEYNEPLTTVMTNLPPNEKVVLVGHSAGGRNVTNVLHKFPEKIHMAIYVAAMMVNFGFLASTDEDSKKFMELGDLSAYELICGLGVNELPTGIMVKPELRSKVLYNVSPIEDATLASQLLRPAPVRALLDLEFVNGLVSESIPRVFIKTLKDELFEPESQDQIIDLWPPSKVLTTQSDHSPFFSTPNELFSRLIEATSSIN